MTSPNNQPETTPRQPEQLIDCLKHESPDERIDAIRSLGDGELSWPEEQKVRLIQELLLLLRDDRANTYVYGLWQCDEQEPATRVCDAAAAILVGTFGYADSVPSVFARAQAAGYPVA